MTKQDKISNLRRLFREEHDCEVRLEERRKESQKEDEFRAVNVGFGLRRGARVVADVAEESLRLIRKFIDEEMEDAWRYPPWHIRHIDQVPVFHEKSGLEADAYEQSVFIMSKYPEGESPKDLELELVIQTTEAAVRRKGFTPRRASDKKYHTILWDNVELYLLGCSRGIAIVEDMYVPEFNPNVALEWGWMRAMGKDVLL